MLNGLNKADKAIIKDLIVDGNDLFVDSRGWWINDQCFESFENLMVFLKNMA